MRLGKIRSPHYRIVVADSRTKRDGRAIEMIGKYHPKEDPSYIEVDSDRVRYWLSVGAQPTEPVKAILRLTGDWQRHVGEPVPEDALKVAAPRADRKAVFDAAAQEAAGITGSGPSAPRARKVEARSDAAGEPAGAGSAGLPADRPAEA
jgi:small subunit ribosomal protein S16